MVAVMLQTCREVVFYRTYCSKAE